MGCDYKIYYNSPNKEWKQLGNMKIKSLSASKDSLWVVDYDDRVPHKFDEVTQRFVKVGTRQAYYISAGLEGHAVMRGKDDMMYGWVETEQTWKIIDKSKVWWMGIGESGRLLKIDQDRDKVFQ